MSARRFLRSIAFAALAASPSLAMAPAASAAIEIDYSVVDLADVMPGLDRWRYDYTVDGRAFSPGDSINIYFDFGTNNELVYQDIGPLTAPANFYPQALQPIQFLLVPGQFDATALSADAGHHLSFSAAFTWLGAGTPGSQSFEVVDPNFNVLERGTTALNVPEPATGVFLVVGVSLLVAARRARCEAEVYRDVGV
jgi:hypothetical protein